MRQAVWLSILVLVCNALYAQSPSTLNNDDSCDVIVAPAATLLLPYFEVDLTRPRGETTLFSVTNVTQVPRIAHVTVWTDWSYPVLNFNIFLTGYDVQSINLYDLLVDGFLSGPEGTTSDDEVGERSFDNDENPLLDITDCDNLAVVLPPSFRQQFQAAFTRGDAPFRRCRNGPVGGAHDHAIGYVTIDVVSSCTPLFPTDAGYFTSEILFDNVLTGDYQQVSPEDFSSAGGPMVHIRAIPEGGVPGARPTRFTTTFYSNLQYGGTADRRQPLPATFAARWSSADGEQKTTFKIWREGVARGDPGCAVVSNGSLTIADMVRFDEDENPVALSDQPRSYLPATSNRSSDDDVFPPNPDGAPSGWMYLNLNNQGVFPFRPFAVASQNWVTVSIEEEGRYSADFDAASLGNGCTPSIPSTGDDETVIAPAGSDDSCDIRVAPAATLLLPYFELNLASPGERTVFTITNVTPLPQIALVTLWTDRAFPVLSFHLFLTGYDVQSIDLFDVVAHGRIPGTTNRVLPGRRSEDNDANVLLDVSQCGAAPEQIPSSILADVRRALTDGRTTACARAPVGSTHPEAIGYATVDVVRNCSPAMPTDAGYFTTQLLYDNVLIGDYQQVDDANSLGRGNTMVHIRAVAEGGLAGGAGTNFRRTFYSRLQNGGTADRRQPLPSTFAARWIDGGVGELGTTYKIWREGVTSAGAGCAVSANGEVSYPDVVRFDEDENPTALITDCGYYLCSIPHHLPAVSRVSADDDGRYDGLPPNPGHALAGWMYFNLDNYEPMGRPLDAIALQNWVVVSMSAEGRLAVEFDAASLGNGCSPPALMTEEYGDAPAIGPAPNVNPGRRPNP